MKASVTNEKRKDEKAFSLSGWICLNSVTSSMHDVFKSRVACIFQDSFQSIPANNGMLKLHFQIKSINHQKKVLHSIFLLSIYPCLVSLHMFHVGHTEKRKLYIE